MTELPLDHLRRSEAELGEARSWVPVAEAARITGISASALRRWQRSGRIAHRLETGRGQGRRLVDLDEVLLLRATGAAGRAGRRPGNVVPLESPRAAAPALRERLERAFEAAAEADRRAAAAEAEAEQLRRRVSELESWVAESSRFEEVEQVQLGRLLALASAEREARRLPLIASMRTLLLVVYLAVVVAFIALLLTRL